MNESCLLVIPSFKDFDRLSVYLPDLCAEFSDDPAVRILVVDDGSGPQEAAAVQKLIEGISRDFKNTIEFLPLETNVGKGGAVYAGWERARADEEWLAFADADGATSASEVRRLISIATRSGSEVHAVIGSRVKMQGRNVVRHLYRHVFGRILATLATAMVELPVHDSQCGIKVVRRASYVRVRPELFETRFGFDMDLLANLHAAGEKIREIPIDWNDVPGSKVSLLSDGWSMILTLWHLRLRMKSRPPRDRGFRLF